MKNIIKSLGIIIFIAMLQFMVYALVLDPIITAWGASENEIAMPMTGDNLMPSIVSTRAITITASKSDVWQCLMQLGAGKCDFYSYDFIERLIGSHLPENKLNKLEYKELNVGDVVRSSVNSNDSIIAYDFPVRYIEQGKTIVLENWGTFLLQEKNTKQTRLIIRTQFTEQNNLRLAAADFIIMPLHYIMERRMLTGIKERVETGGRIPLSIAGDILWFLGVILSGICIAVLIFRERGIRSVLLPSVLSILWLLVLFTVKPTPVYSVNLFLVIFLINIFDNRTINYNKTDSKKLKKQVA
jgi:hypothetical protein